MTPMEQYLLDLASGNVKDDYIFHKLIYRGKSLGTSVTQDQYDAIKQGNFKDIYIGDYWTINGLTYVVADIDYWLYKGDTPCTTHHVVLVPKAQMYTAKMNNENITTGAYVGSVMYKTNLQSAKNTINAAFGTDHILKHRVLLANATNGSTSNAYAWYDSTVDLMNREMVFNTQNTNIYDTGIDDIQLSLFTLKGTDAIKTGSYWWLRGVYNAASFYFVNNDGSENLDFASYDLGVRPAFAICA